MALEHKVNLHYFSNGHVGLSIDETTDISALNELLRIFATAAQHEFEAVDDVPYINSINKVLLRTSSYLTHEVFQKYHTEMEMMRYIKRLDRKDISLTHSMISLGSCTMKMNPASEMLPLSLSGFTNLHPLVPAEQAQGYRKLINNLCEELQIITGFDGVTLEPNSGAAGEYTGLRIIRSYLESIGQNQRNIIPHSSLLNTPLLRTWPKMAHFSRKA